MSCRFINAWDPAVIPGLRKVTDGVHAHGARIFSQLTHGGHTSLERPPHIMWAPTQMPEPSTHFTTKAMDADDICAVIAGFATSARNAIDAGYDGIEIKIAHDGLLRSFASPYFNRRTDAYGGSFENRMRLSYEVLEAIKQAIGHDTPLGVRICLDEFTSFGYDLEYGLQMVRALEATGCVDYFNSDAGSFSSFWMEIPPAAVAATDFDRLNRALKRAARIPVIAFGRITPPQRGEDLLRAGDADMIGWARQLIADPADAKQAEGRPPGSRPILYRLQRRLHLPDLAGEGHSLRPQSKRWTRAPFQRADAGSRVAAAKGGGRRRRPGGHEGRRNRRAARTQGRASGKKP